MASSPPVPPPAAPARALIRNDLVLVHNRGVSFERAFVINDRASNRYWQVGPLQYEMARIFSRGRQSWPAACAELRALFAEPIDDPEIEACYAQFGELGLHELSPSAVREARLQLSSYRRALRQLGLKVERGGFSDDVTLFLRRVEARSDSPETFASDALAIARACPNDSAAVVLVQAFYRALHMERVVRDNAHIPALLRWMRLQVPLFDPNAQLERWLPRVSFLLRPWFVAVLAVLSLWGFSSYVDHAREVHQRLPAVSGNLSLLFFCTVLMLIVHEYAHAFVCKLYGGEVREMGIIVFLFFLPAAYCDVSDAHLFSSRRQKLWVTFAGTGSTFVLASLGALIWSNTVPSATLNHIGLVLMASGYATVLTNLNPLLPLDGYFFLCDLLGIDNLRDVAPDYARRFLAALFTGKPRPQVSRREQRLYFAFFLFGSLYQVFYLLVSIGFGWLILVRGGTLVGLVVYVALVYLFYVRNYWLRLVQLWRESRTKQLFAYVSLGAALLVLLAFVPVSTTVTLPVVVRETGRIKLLAAESATVQRVAVADGEAVIEGEELFAFRVGKERHAFLAPAGGVVTFTRAWYPGASIAAGEQVGEIVTGHALEGDLPQKYVADLLDPLALHAAVLGQDVALLGLTVEARAKDGRNAPVVRAGIVASAEIPLKIENGQGARLVVRSRRTTSVWRRLWGDQWDKVILDVWRLL